MTCNNVFILSVLTHKYENAADSQHVDKWTCGQMTSARLVCVTLQLTL